MVALSPRGIPLPASTVAFRAPQASKAVRGFEPLRAMSNSRPGR
jgi:hypothetical protein